MRKIKIFIGSSIEELKEDRVSIGNFFRQLNDLYLDNGLYFQLIMCEDYDDAIELEGKQSRYDKEIEDSELSVFIFYKKVGVYTEHEFDVAFNHFKAEHRPKILTVFKCISDASEIVESVKDFADRLDKEYKHYYKTYTNTDSLKLWLIMQIKSMGLDQSIVEFRDGKVVINGESVASYASAPAFSEHSELKAKKERLAALKEEYVRLKAEYLENGDDVDVYVKYSQVAKEKSELENDIAESEKKIITQLENIYAVTAKGGLSERQIIGYRLIDAGKYDEALQILDKDEIFGDIIASERMLDYGRKIVENAMTDLQTGVNELKQRIETLKLKGVTPESEQEIILLYERVCELSGKYGLDLDTYLDFADFIREQGKPEKGYELLNGARDLFEKCKDFDVKADYWYMLGLVASLLGKRQEDLECRTKALKINEGLLMIEETDKRLALSGKVYHAISLHYGYDDARGLEYAEKSVEIFEKLSASSDDRKYKKFYAMSLQRLASATSDGIIKHRCYKKALDIMESFVSRANASEDEKKKYVMAMKAYLLGPGVVKGKYDFIPGSWKRVRMEKALAMASELAQKNPNGCESTYVAVLACFGEMIYEGSYNESPEPYYIEAFKIYEKMLYKNTANAFYLYSLAAERLAKYYRDIDGDKSREYYLIAVNGYERAASDEFESRPRAVALYLYCAAEIYIRLNDLENAARCHKRGLDVYDTIDELNDDDRQWMGWINDDIEKYNLAKYF